MGWGPPRPPETTRIVIKDKISLTTGVLLVSPPMQWDPNFRRSVVLLCEHAGAGSFGLILNRSLTVSMDQLFDDLRTFPEEVGWGGPVQPETLHFVHREADIIPDAIEIRDGVHWGGDFDVVREQLAAGVLDPDDIRFFLGYAGWSAGQLQTEVDRGGWIMAHSSEDLVFDVAEDDLWRQVLREKGGAYAILANAPDHPSLN